MRASVLNRALRDGRTAGHAGVTTTVVTAGGFYASNRGVRVAWWRGYALGRRDVIRAAVGETRTQAGTTAERYTRFMSRLGLLDAPNAPTTDAGTP